MFYQKVHGLELADNGEIRKLRPEVVDTDPVAVAPGRIWYNRVDHKLKFSDLDESGVMTTRIVLDEEEVKKHRSAISRVSEGVEVYREDPVAAARKPGQFWLNSTTGLFKYARAGGEVVVLAEAAVVVQQLVQLDADLRAHTEEAINAYDTSTRVLITQPAHGFTILTPVYTDGTTWLRANANAMNTLAVAVVADVIDADTFELRQTGRVGITGHGLAIGEYYFLSDSVAGTLSRTEPEISQPLYYIEDADHVIALQYRPSVTPDPNLHQHVWKDLTAPLNTAKQAGGSMPTWEGIGGSNFYAYGFDSMKPAEVIVLFHLGHDYALGTDIFPHIHWTPATASIGTVRWVLELAYAKGHGQGAFNLNSPVILAVEQLADGTPLKHYVAEALCSNFTAALEPDGIVMMRLYRDAAHPNDTFPDSAYGLQADLHYQANMIGTANKAPNFYGI